MKSRHYIRKIIIVLSLGLIILFAFNAQWSTTASGGEKLYVDQHYPDFGFLPLPSEYDGRVFTLSQKYPTKEPAKSQLPKFLRTNFERKWRKYLIEAQNYVFLDNVKGRDVANDFDAAAQKIPTWFHVPWQHYGKNGREGVHGLTKEAPVQLQQLAISQTYTGGQMYAVGLYNVFGAYTIGKVWADKDNPDVDNILFPVGTVVMKILFTDVPADQVPSLVNPITWKAYVTQNYKSEIREFKDLTLVQMDLMVRDDRSPYGWVFGFYQYNGKLNNKNKWKNLTPVGIQWGNDPKVNNGTWGEYTNPVPAITRINPNLKETIINADSNELPPTHLGWNGRLAGPADNYLSSCMSCHMTAEYPALSPMSPLFQAPDKIPSVGSKGWMRWFQNNKWGVPFDKGAKSTDFSLQLAASLQNYFEWKGHGDRIMSNTYGKKKDTGPVVYKIRRARD